MKNRFSVWFETRLMDRQGIGFTESALFISLKGTHVATKTRICQYIDIVTFCCQMCN